MAVEPPKAGRPRLPQAVVALGLTSFLTDVGSEMIFPLLPVFVASLGAGPAFLGLIEGVAEAVASTLKLVSGYVAERTRSEKAFVVFGYSLAAFVRPLVALATAPWHVLAIRVSDRVGKGMRSAPRDALLSASVSKDHSGRAFGFHRAMDHAGAVVGPLVATGLLALGFSLRNVFAAAIVPGLLSVVVVATVRAPAMDKKLRIAPTVPKSPGGATGDARFFPSYLAILLFFSLGGSSDAFLLLRSKELGVPVHAIPMLWAAFHVSKVLAARLGGSLADRFSRPKLIVAGWCIYGATYLAFGFGSRAWHAWVLLVIYGASSALAEPAEKALVKDLVPAGHAGRGFGLYNFVLGISAIPAGLLTGWLWKWGAGVALGACAGFAFVAAGALFVWNARRTAFLGAKLEKA
jgi:MFS family permease